MGKLDVAVNSITSWVVVTVGGVGAWLVRRILTNQKEIDLLKQDLTNRERMREEDREQVSKIETDVRDIKNTLLGWSRK